MGFADFRAATTTKSRVRNLPPITDKTRHENFKKGTRNERQTRDQSCWAKSWAKERAAQTNVHSKDFTGVQHGKLKHFRSLDSLNKSGRKKKEVIAMNEKEAMLLKRLKGIYANSTERNLQAQRLQKSINSIQTRTIHSEIDLSMKEYKRRLEEDKRNRSELKRLRDRYSKDRERRHRSSYVSLSALQCPCVSRMAYGLPEDGQEDRQSGVTQQTQEKLRDIWKNAIRRAALVDKIIRKRTQEKDPLPHIKIRRESIAQRETRDPSSTNEKEGNLILELSFFFFNRRKNCWARPNPVAIQTGFLKQVILFLEPRQDSKEAAERLEVMLGEIDAMTTGTRTQSVNQIRQLSLSISQPASQTIQLCPEVCVIKCTLNFDNCHHKCPVTSRRKTLVCDIRVSVYVDGFLLIDEV